MPTRYDSEDDLHDVASGDREISLGTGTVLAIFLGLALVCSLFFGLGYSMGKKSAPAAAPVASNPYTANLSSDDRSSPRSVAAIGSSRPDTQVVQPAVPSEGESTPAIAEQPVTQRSHDKPAAAKAAVVAPDVSETIPPPSAVPVASGTQLYVQVAAVSRKEDADLLLNALRHRGYAGLIRQQTADKLLHIQVGPFPTKKDAEAMRQRLIADGYNPIIK